MAKKRRPKFGHKARLNLRDKLRPVRQTRFNIELRVCPTINVPLVVGYGGGRWISERERDLYNELQLFFATLRAMVYGRFKIIQQRKTNVVVTKVLLENESDLVLLTIAHPTLIGRAYRYTNR
jgi:hypothetical protein